MEYKFTLTPGKLVTLSFTGQEPDLLDIQLLEAYMGVIRQTVAQRVQAQPSAPMPAQRSGVEQDNDEENQLEFGG